MGVLLDVLLLAGGILALIFGGDTLVKGSVTLSLKLGVKPLIIGLTVVAFGTSAPELALNMVAAAKNNTPLAFGNIVGSNIANVGLILGLLALLKPLKVDAGLVKREMPIMLGITGMALLLAFLGLTHEPVVTTPDAEPTWPGFSRIDGLLMLGCFATFMVWIVRSSMTNTGATKVEAMPIAAGTDEIDEADARRPMWLAILLIVVGLGLLIAGGQGAEIGASGIAAALGMTPELIGLTVVAVATSLPELFAGLMAIRRNQVDIAVGNVIGSNIFNLALVLGATAAITPVPVPPGGIMALIVMTALSLALIPMSHTGGRTIARIEGLVLLLIYAGYLGVLVVGALNR